MNNIFFSHTRSLGIVESLHLVMISRNSSTDIGGKVDVLQYKRLK